MSKKYLYKPLIWVFSINNYKRHLVYFNILLIYPFIIFSQTPELNNSLIPPSPEAAALGKYGILPVTLYTGMPNISVPIIDLKTSKLSISIAFDYNYNGYRPGEVASNIGLGWSLKGGGVITRIIKGKADEATNYLNHWADYANMLDLSTNLDFLDVCGLGLADTEPDIYMYNFNGHSGKFIMVGNQAYLFPHQDIKIETQGNGFEITAEDGISYYFEETENTHIPRHSNNDPYVPDYISAWYLTKIVSADFLDEIKFNYSSWYYSTINIAYSEVYTTKLGPLCNGGCNGASTNCDSWGQNKNGCVIGAKVLSSIEGKNYIINFTPETTPRKDLYNSIGFPLKEVVITRKEDQVVLKKMKLIHDYFGDPLSASNSQLKLTSIDLEGFYNNNIFGINVPATPLNLTNYYTFQYNNEQGNYPKETTSIDKWGYYNGKTNMMLFDASLLGRDLLNPAADREVDPTKSNNGILSKITYPTKGYTEFEYEMNRVNAGGPHNQNEVQQQVNKTTNFVSNPSNTPTVEGQTFTLNESQAVNIILGRDISQFPNGIINYIPILKIYEIIDDQIGNVLYTSNILTKTSISRTESLQLQAGTYFYSVSCEYTSASTYANISYKWLLPVPPYIGDPGPGLRIKNIKSYDGNKSTPSLIKSYTYAIGTLLQPNTGYSSYITSLYSGGNMADETVFSSNYSSSLSTLVGNQFFYPELTEINDDVANGSKTVYEYAGSNGDALGVILKKQTDYSYKNNIYTKIRQKINTYDVKTISTFGAFTYNLRHYVDGPCGLSGAAPLQGNIYDIAERFKLYESHPYSLVSDCFLLAATDEIDYAPDGLNSVTKHTNYFYENPNHLFANRVTTTNSKNEEITTSVKYPLDYNLANCIRPAAINAIYDAERIIASNSFATCVTERLSQAISYYNPTILNANNGPLLNVLLTHPCESNYKAASVSIVYSLNSRVNNYIQCLLSPNSLPRADKSIIDLEKYHIINQPIEQIVSVNKNNSDFLLKATKTDFTTGLTNTITPKVIYQAEFAPGTLKSDLLNNPGQYYVPKVNFTHDFYGILMEQSKENNFKLSYIWDYNYQYPVAQVTGSSVADIAYTGFESDGSGYWNIPTGGRQAVSITGSKSYDLGNGAISKNYLDALKSYTVSFWLQPGASATVSGSSAVVKKTEKNGWACYEAKVSGANTISVSGSGNIDELRLYPSTAQMITYVYDPLTGLTSSCSANNVLSYYEYDPMGRLKVIKNQDVNILKTFEYKYQQ